MKQFLQKLTAVFLMFATCNFATAQIVISPVGGGGGTPGGSDTYVQYNDGGAFGGESVFTYNKTTNVLSASALNVNNATFPIPNNGIYQSASDSVNFSTDSTLRGGFTSNGHFNVSNNTTDIAKLSIKGDGTTTGKSLGIVNSSGTTTAYINDSGAASMGVNTVTGSQAFAAGNNNTSSGNYSIALGDGNTATTTTSIAIGSACVSSAVLSIALGGNCNATASYSLCTGFRTISSRRGQRTFSGDGFFGADGAAQGIELTLQVKTTNATATTLWLNGASQGANLRFNLQSGYVVSGILTVHGIKSDGSAVAMFVRQISYKNVGGTSSEVFAPVTIGTDNASGCALTFLNPDTNDAIEPQVAGIAAETWRWTASFHGVETAYGN